MHKLAQHPSQDSKHCHRPARLIVHAEAVENRSDKWTQLGDEKLTIIYILYIYALYRFFSSLPYDQREKLLEICWKFSTTAR